MNFIWATRGKSWGFRFLQNGGVTDPLSIYEYAFSSIQNELEVCNYAGDKVALRLLDPLNRKDRAGRPIFHEFVVFRPLADRICTLEKGRELIWPRVADQFARVWELPEPPLSRE